MQDSFTLALYSLLIITGSGVIAIAAARLTGVHPAFFFICLGSFLGIVLPFTLPAHSLLVQLAELGALFLVFLSALELEWGTQFKINRWSFFSGMGLEILAIVLLAAVAFFFLQFDFVAAVALASLTAMHAPGRGPALVVQSFRSNRVTNDAQFTGLLSEITALVIISLLAVYIHRPASGLRALASGDLIQVGVGALLVLLILLSFLPQGLRFLLKRVGEESYALFYLMLALVVAVLLVTIRSGIEPVLGAYAAGFVLTRFVAEDSKVLDRLRFTGQSIIIPAFFIELGIGSNFILAATLPILGQALVLLAATFFLRLVMSYFSAPKKQKRIAYAVVSLRKNPLMLVLIYIAYAKGLIPSNALYALILYALFNEALVALLTGGHNRGNDTVKQHDAARVLLPVSNPETMLPLLTLATHLGSAGMPAKVYPLNIVPDDANAAERIRLVEAQFNELIELYATREQYIELTARIENDRIRAVAHAARELLIDRILLGLGVIPTLTRPQGYSFLESLTATATETTIVAAHTEADLSATTSISVIIASRQLASRADSWLSLILNLSRRLKANPVFFGEASALDALQEHLASIEPARKYEMRAGHIHAGLDLVTFAPGESTLAVGIIDRPAFAQNEKIHSRLPEMMLRAFSERNFILVYPPQETQHQALLKSQTAWRKVKRFMGFA